MNEDDAARLRRAINRLARAFNAPATSEGLTPTQASVLGLAVTRGPLAVSAMIEAQRLNPSVLSRVMGRLESSGLLHRTAGSSDQRTVWVEATVAGRRIYERIMAQRSALVLEHVAQLTSRQADELTHAVTALEALVDIVDRQVTVPLSSGADRPPAG